jgi:hypothetical protein
MIINEGVEFGKITIIVACVILISFFIYMAFSQKPLLSEDNYICSKITNEVEKVYEGYMGHKTEYVYTLENGKIIISDEWYSDDTEYCYK